MKDPFKCLIVSLSNLLVATIHSFELKEGEDDWEPI
jgi:hypothetical protein